MVELTSELKTTLQDIVTETTIIKSRCKQYLAYLNTIEPITGDYSAEQYIKDHLSKSMTNYSPSEFLYTQYCAWHNTHPQYPKLAGRKTFSQTMIRMGYVYKNARFNGRMRRGFLCIIT